MRVTAEPVLSGRGRAIVPVRAAPATQAAAQPQADDEGGDQQGAYLGGVWNGAGCPRLLICCRLLLPCCLDRLVGRRRLRILMRRFAAGWCRRGGGLVLL